MKLLLVFNPRAGGGRAGRQLPAISGRLQAAGIDFETSITEHSGHAEQLVRDMDTGRFDGVAVAGGDGTLSQALNGLMSHHEALRLPLGLIPLGTGNAFSRDIGLEPNDWKGGIDQIARSRLGRVDAGRIETRTETFHFLNIAGLGFVTDAGLTAAKLKFAGKSAYTLATLWRILQLRSYALELEVDGQAFREDNLFVEVSNSRYTGTSFLIAPAAKIDDGLLDITTVRKLARFRLLKLFPSVFRGEHIRFDEVTTTRGQSIRITSPEGLGLMVDGEFRGETPVRIDCLPGAVRMFI